MSPLLVLGIGNTERGDDAAGRAVARLLRGALPAHVAVEEQEGEATALVARLEGIAAAYLVDASPLGRTAGHDPPLRRRGVAAAAARIRPLDPWLRPRRRRSSWRALSGSCRGAASSTRSKARASSWARACRRRWRTPLPRSRRALLQRSRERQESASDA